MNALIFMIIWFFSGIIAVLVEAKIQKETVNLGEFLLGGALGIFLAIGILMKYIYDIRIFDFRPTIKKRRR